MRHKFLKYCDWLIVNIKMTCMHPCSFYFDYFRAEVLNFLNKNNVIIAKYCSNNEFQKQKRRSH